MAAPRLPAWGPGRGASCPGPQGLGAGLNGWRGPGEKLSLLHNGEEYLVLSARDVLAVIEG